MSIKKNSLNQCEIPKQVWVYNVWSSVLYSFQVYYKTAISNPESNSENQEYFSEQNNEHIACCLATSTCPLINLWEQRRKLNVPNLQRGPATMRSVYKSDNKYRHPNGLQQQIFLKIFSSCIHTSIRLTETMSFLNPLIYS